MKYLKQLSIYTLVSFLSAGVGFLLMPYLSHFLKPKEYGILAMVNSLVTILIPFVGLTAAGIIKVEYYEQKNKAEFASLFSSVQVLPVLPFIFVCVLSWALAIPIANFFEIPADKYYWIPLSCILAFFSIYYETLISYNVTEQKPIVFAIFALSRLFIEVGLTVLFITRLGYGWEGRLYSWLIATAVMFVISILYFKKKQLLTFNISKKYLRAALGFGLPLILHVVGKFIINQSDRIFIAKMISIEEAGIYNIGYQVGTIMLLIVSVVGNSIQPFFYERLASQTKEAKLEIVKMSYGIIVSFILMLLMITIATPTLFSLIDDSYTKGTKYVFWVGLSYFFWGVYLLFSGYIFFTKKTKFLGYLAIFNVLLNAGLNYLLIKNYGAIGAAWATCISFFVVALLTAIEANKRVKLPWIFFIK